LCGAFFSLPVKFCLTILFSCLTLALAVANDEASVQKSAPEAKTTIEVVVAPKGPIEIVVSVAEQKMALVQDGVVVKKFLISTSRYGVGDKYGSYRTPLGKLRVCDKVGDKQPQGAVFKKRVPTGEILPVNSPGRDPIVTRILWLDGTEATNSRARERGIYIHGTPVERQLGRPVSYGCIRMSSVDVVEVFNSVPVGTAVTITMERLPRPKNRSLTDSIVELFADTRKSSKHDVVTR
jgi:lipoprotein-anchoring transpeptidase ErfK/SrfK